jgi:hypothetical protein
MPGTGHSHRYKSSISNRNAKPAFQVLAPWNKGKLGKPGQVPVIAEGGGNLQFSSHLNLDSVTLSANSVHFDSSGGQTHSLGIDKDGCLAHTVKNNLGTAANFAPVVCFNHGIKTNSIAPESSSIIPTAIIDVSRGVCSAPPLSLTGMSGFIKIPATDTSGEHAIIMANSTLWFGVSNDKFSVDGGGMFFLQFSLPDSNPIHFGDCTGECNFIYPGGITVMWSGGLDGSDGKERLFGLQNPNPHDISFYASPEKFSPCISWIYFTPYSGS